MRTLTCQHPGCELAFTTRDNRLYCDRHSTHTWQQWRYYRKHVATGATGEPGQKACSVCGETYQAKGPAQRYCGDACRERARRPKTTPRAIRSSEGPPPSGSQALRPPGVSLDDVCRQHGIRRTTYYQRRKAGLTHEQALAKPLRVTRRADPTRVIPVQAFTADLFRAWLSRPLVAV